MAESQVFKNIPEEIDYIRTIPKGGGWILINRELGHIGKQANIQRTDIVWGFDEKTVLVLDKGIRIGRPKTIGSWDWLMEAVNEHFQTEELEKAGKITTDTEGKVQLKTFVDDDREEFQLLSDKEKKDIFLETHEYWVYGELGKPQFGRRFPIISEAITIVDVATELRETVRLYDYEFTPEPQEFIDELLAEDLIEPVILGSGENGIMPSFFEDEYMRDLVGALQLDGLSKAAAINEMITAGELEDMYMQIPDYKYQLKGAAKDMYLR